MLAKLFARSEKTADLYNLIQEPNNIVLSEIEPVLRESGQYNALCMIYGQRGDDTNLLHTWSRCTPILYINRSLTVNFMQTRGW